MTPELTALALAFLVQIVQIVLYSVRGNLDVGAAYSASARDREPSRALSELGGRLQRAMNNHFEGLILFTIAVVLVTVSGQSNGFTVGCAWVYLGLRVLYVPAYAFGLRPWRSVIWVLSTAATIAMVISTLI